MGAAEIIQVILQFGVPVAEQVYKMFANSSSPPTADDWATLKALAGQTARTRMQATLVANGIDPASPQGQALLALTP